MKTSAARTFTTWIPFLGLISLLALNSSCTVERIDRCKTIPTACPGLLDAPAGVTLVSLTPTSQSVTSLPTAIIATFSEGVTALDASKFVITGTCANLPTVNSVAMSTDDTVATANISGGVCQNNQSFTVTVTPASITDLNGEAGAGSALSSTFTMISLGPTATLAAPSSVRLRNATSATIALTYTDATATTLSDAGVTKNETGTSCNVAVSGASASGATLTVSGCTGDGTITVSVNAGTATNSAGDLSSASPVSAVITVDNTGPTLTSLTPATATLVTTPVNIVATFNEKMTDLVPSSFAISGSCAIVPTVSGVVMSSGGAVATANLAGGMCNDTQNLIVTVTPASLQDEAGNPGVGGAQTRTYTVSTSGPTANLAVPSVTRINSSGTATIALTYNGAVATTLTNSGITKNETGTSCTVTVSGASAAGATLTVSDCSGNGTMTVSVNAGTATDSLGNASSASAASSVITVDNTGPTLTNLTPVSASLGTMPSTVVATFNEGMATIDASKFLISGTCSTLPTVTGVAMSAGSTIATATLTGAVCLATQTLTVTVSPPSVADIAGNIGTGSATAVTYTKIDSPAVLEIIGNGNMGDSGCGDATVNFDLTNTSVSTATVKDIYFSNGLMNVFSGCPTTMTPGMTCSIEVRAPQGSSGSGQLIIEYNNQLTDTDVRKTLTVTNLFCGG